MGMTIEEARKRSHKKLIEGRLYGLSKKQKDFQNNYGAYDFGQYHSVDEASAMYNAAQELYDLTNTYKYYLNTYGGGDAKTISGLDETLSNYKNLLNTRDSYIDLYSQYNSAEAFNADIERRKRLQTMDINASKSELERLKNSYIPWDKYTPTQSQEKDRIKQLEKDILEAEKIQKLAEYDALENNSDFATFSNIGNLKNPTKEELDAYDAKQSDASLALSNGGYYDERGNVYDEDGNLIANAYEANGIQDKLDLYLSARNDPNYYNTYVAEGRSSKINNSWLDVMEEGQNNFWEYINEEEKAKYYYLKNTVGDGAADEYLEYLTPTFADREAEKIYAWSADNKHLASILSILSQPLSSVEQLESMFTGDINRLSNVTSSLRSGASSELGGFGTFLYNTGMSAADSALAALMPGFLGEASLALSAAGSTQNDILSRGGSQGQAIAGGIAAGIAEAFFEHFSLELLRNMDTKTISRSFSEFAKELAIEAGTNASEEAFTEIANIISDEIIMGSMSNISEMYDDAIRRGMSDSTARLYIAGQIGAQVAESAASGALMGATFTAIGGTKGAISGEISSYKEGKKFASAPTAKADIAETLDAAKSFGKGTAAYKAAQKYEKRATNARLGRLVEETAAESAKRAKSLEAQKAEKKAILEKASENVSETINAAKRSAQNANVAKEASKADIKYEALPSIVDYTGTTQDDITVTDKDGKEKKLSEVTVEDEDITVVYSLAATLGSVEAANNFISAYNDESHAQGFVDPDIFWVDWMSIQTHGQISTWEGAMEQAFARVGDRMSENAKTAAFLAGRGLRESSISKIRTVQEKYDKAWKDAGGKTTDAKFDDNALKGVKLTKEQIEYQAFLKTFSKAMGMNITVFASEKGKRAENGSYKRDTNTVRIDINAGIGNNANYNAMLNGVVNTLSHETVHNMRIVANKEYEALKDFVISELEKDDSYNLDDAIEHEIQKYAAKGQEITPEDAVEEIVARACEDRLANSEKLRDFLIELNSADKGASNAFIKFVKQFIERLKSFFENVAKIKSNITEAALFASKGEDIVNELQKRFDDAVLAMREGNMARNAVKENSSAELSGTVYQLRGVNKNGIEVYETSDEIKKLPIKERQKAFLDIMKNEYQGRTAKFIRNGHTYYASFDYRDISKNVYGDKLSDKKGWKAKINVGAEGEIFELVENAKYNGSKPESGKKIAAHSGVVYWDYFVKTVQIDNAVFDLVANVRKKNNGNFVYSIQLNENKKIEASPSLGSPNGVLNRMLNASNNSIPQNEQKSSGFEKNQEMFQDRDTDYLDAVKRGDMETAQKMVDEAARKAGYTVKAYHGSKENFTIFDYGKIGSSTGVGMLGEGFYFTDKKNVAKGYGSKLYTVYLKAQNPYMAVENDIYRLNSYRLQEQGYDSIRFSVPTGTVYSIFENTQIKSADPVTYDDNGNVIPLSERFKADNQDIRYQEREDKTTNSDKFVSMLERWDGKTIGFSFVLGETSEALQKANIPKKQIRWDASKIASLLRKHNGMNIDIIKKIPNLLENPIIVIDSKKGENSKIVMGDLYDANNKIITAVLLLTPTSKKGNVLDLIKISSAEGRGHINSLFTNDDKTPVPIRYVDKKRIQSWLNVNGLQLPLHNLDLDSNNIVSQENKNVNISSETFSQDRIDLPDPSEILSDLFKDEKAYAGYREHAESLQKYKDLQDRVKRAQRRIEDLDKQISELQHKRAQSGKGTRMNELHRMRNTAKDNVDRYQRQMFQMEATDLRDVVYSEARRLVRETEKAEREKYRNRRDSIKDTAKRSEYIASIEKQAKKLTNDILENSKDRHIPDIFKKTVENFISSIDFASKRALSGGEETKRASSITESIRDMQEMLNNASDPELENYLNDCDMSDSTAKEFTAIYERLKKLEENYGKRTMVLNQMSTSDLRDLRDAIVTLSHQISRANKLMANNRYDKMLELFEQTRIDLDDFEKYKKAEKSLGKKWSDAYEWTNALPYYAFKRMGKAAFSLFEEFMDGFDAFAFKAKEIVDTAEETFTAKEAKEWSNEIHKIEFSKDDVIYMTTADIMSFYCLIKRAQAKQHITAGGIQLSNKTGKIDGDKKQTYANSSSGVYIDEARIIKITSLLNDRQREVADKLQHFMATTCALWGNEVSYKRFGVKQFLDPDYFPIKSSSETLQKKGDENVQSRNIYALLNSSFSQKLDTHANNRIEISDIFKVFAEHTVEMAKYNSFALPLIDIRKWQNLKVKTGESLGEEGKGMTNKEVRSMLKDAFGDSAERYINKFLESINSMETREGDLGVLQSFISKYKVQAVAANINVTLVQPLSYLRVGVVMNPKYMLAEVKDTFKIREAIKRAEKYSGMMVWKGMGYRDVNLAAPLLDKITRNQNVVDKINDVALKGAEVADKITWGAIWIACENEISDTHKDLTHGSEEYYNAVKKRFREVIYASQVVDSPLTKTQFMREKTLMHNLLGSFMSEPSVTHNLFMDVVTDITDSRRNGQQKKITVRQFRRLLRVSNVLIISSFAEAVLRSFMDALHSYDEEDEEFFELYFENFFETFLSSMFMPKTPILKTIVEAIKGALTGAYSSSRMETDAVERLARLARMIYKLAAGDDVSETKLFKTLMDAISAMFGLPISNVYREIKSFWNAIVGAQNPSLLIK